MTVWPARPATGRRGPAPEGGTGHRDAAALPAAVVRSLGRAARTLATPAGLARTAVELAWVGTHLGLYPFGAVSGRTVQDVRGYRVEHLPPVQRSLLIGDVEASGTPILLVHGLVDNRSIFTLLSRGLRRRGFGRVVSVNYSPLTTDVRTAAAGLAEEVGALVAETGYERVHVVGHSLGGLIARYYVTRLGGDARVHTVVTLGTPHEGTCDAYALPIRLGRQLRPGSELMRELAAPVERCATRFVAYWSDLDPLVVPQEHARITHPDLRARNVRLRGVGHMSLPITRSVVHGISTVLAHLEQDGSARAAGVTPLPAPRAH